MDSVTARRAGEMLESILLSPVLRPLVAGNGMLGDYELELLAQEIARSDGGRFAAMIAARLERVR